MKILIAEDERVTQTLLRGTLQKWGHEVVTCDDGAEAWEKMQQPDAPLLAILDWSMPKLEGPEICRCVRENPNTQHQYLILLTARQEPNDLILGLESGADDYLVKPINWEELRVRLQVGARILTIQAQALASEQARVMIQTAGAAAHEINQPLSVILGMSDLWLQTLPEEHELRLDAKYVYDAACRISTIVKHMQSAKAYATIDYVGNEKIVNFSATSDPDASNV